MSANHQQPSSSASAPGPAGSACPPIDGKKPKVTVVCPSGFTKSSLQGLDPKKPLYARVTYQPH